jgi:hypothetical protein
MLLRGVTCESNLVPARGYCRHAAASGSKAAIHKSTHCGASNNDVHHRLLSQQSRHGPEAEDRVSDFVKSRCCDNQYLSAKMVKAWP